jgi:hypothetical protein
MDFFAKKNPRRRDLTEKGVLSALSARRPFFLWVVGV